MSSIFMIETNLFFKVFQYESPCLIYARMVEQGQESISLSNDGSYKLNTSFNIRKESPRILLYIGNADFELNSVMSLLKTFSALRL